MTRQRQPSNHRPSPPTREASGQPLEVTTRSLLEPRFGHNFGSVRVHSDAAADALAASHEARALAIGQDLYFGAGQYAPQTPAGLHLLAHELTHTVQHQRFGSHGAGRSQSSDASEVEARGAAHAVMAGGAVTVATPLSAAVSAFGWFDDDYNPNPTPVLPKDANMGWRQPGDNDPGGAYAYNKSNKDGTGVEFGAGAYHSQKDGNSVDIGPSINVKGGEFDTGDGDTRWGWTGTATGSGGKGGAGLPGIGKGDVGVGTASFDANIGTDGASLGVQANAVEGSLTAGDLSKDRNNDETTRVGGSLGEGLSARLHWGDKDKDGFREYGFGFDAGPLSVDMKTEDPLRSAARGLGMLGGPLGMSASSFLTDAVLPEGNATEQLYNKAGLTGKGAGIGSTLEAMGDLTNRYLPGAGPSNPTPQLGGGDAGGGIFGLGDWW